MSSSAKPLTLPGVRITETGGKGQLPLYKIRTMADFADAVGCALNTMQSYRSRGYLPEPYAYVQDVPVWSDAQMRAFLRTRPGRGARRDVIAAEDARPTPVVIHLEPVVEHVPGQMDLDGAVVL